MFVMLLFGGLVIFVLFSYYYVEADGDRMVMHSTDLKNRSCNRGAPCDGNASKTEAAAETSGPLQEHIFAEPFRQNGGIFLFLHIPKTGGSTIRAYLQDQVQDDSFYFGTWENGGKVDVAYRRMDDYCVNGTPQNSSVILEAHGNVLFRGPHDLSKNLARWKGLARENRVPFFAFTVLREPVAWYISFFDYFYVFIKKKDATESEFEANMVANMQCGELVGINKGARNFTYQECTDAMNSLIELMDWVFTTEQISTELIPLISYLGRFENRKVGIIQPTMYDSKQKHLEDMSNEGKERLLGMTTWDMELYHKIQQHYNFSNWRNYLDSQHALNHVCTWYRKEGTCV